MIESEALSGDGWGVHVWINAGWLALGLALLYFGAEWLVRGSSRLALRMGISPLVVGLTVVAFGTSVPELLVSLQANLREPPQGDLAIGNIVGSNICNVALILATGALIGGLKTQTRMVRREFPVLIGASVLFAAMLWDRRIDRWEAAILASGIIAYLWSSLSLARREGAEAEDVSREDVKAAKRGGWRGIPLNALLIIAGLGTLIFGANRLILGGVGIAEALEVPEVVIGLTLVALGTSLPELATSVVASLKGQGDLIIGNAIGSCIFNILAVIGIAGLVAPLDAGKLEVSDLAVMLGSALLAFLFMRMHWRLSRKEGAVLLAGYLLYCGWLVL